MRKKFGNAMMITHNNEITCFMPKHLLIKPCGLVLMLRLTYDLGKFSNLIG